MMSAIILAAAVTLIEGTASIWTDGIHVWAGNPYCAESGLLLAYGSPAIDAGVMTEPDCPVAGSAINQPRQADGSYCIEWYGAAPDIGACEFVPTPPMPPNNLRGS